MSEKIPFKKRAIDGKIVRSDKNQGGVFVEDFGLPPKVRGLSLPTAIGRQLSYWGLERTFVAYQKAVKAGVSAGTTVKELYKVSRELDIERERWVQGDANREIARREIRLEMLGQEKQLILAEMEVDDLKKERALQDLQDTIIRNNKEIELAKTETALKFERQAQKEIEGGLTEGKSLDAKLSGLFEDYGKTEQIDEFRTRLIEMRGGEENLTEEDDEVIDHAFDLVKRKLSKTAEF